MSPSSPGNNDQAIIQHQKMRSYYKLHARIYDMTRWAFLFGRNYLIEQACQKNNGAHKILEVGCGTGKNLVKIARSFNDSEIYGLDVSSEMLNIARKKIGSLDIKAALIEMPYSNPLLANSDGFDLIVFSYCLSMINPGWLNAIETAQKDLSSNGSVAVVDFHHSKYDFFRKWMNCNHVEMKAQILPELQKRFKPQICEIRKAYYGLWEYFIFIGVKR